MYLTYWRDIWSLDVNQYPTTLKSFVGSDFLPYRNLPSLVMELGGMTISIGVEVVDAPLDYNFLLGCNRFYTMTSIASSVFHLVQFPH